MEKLSAAQTSQLLKLGSARLRELSAEKAQLKEKLAHYEKKEHCEKIAHQMEEKGLKPELSLHEKVAELMQRDNLAVIEQAVDLNAPQIKTASAVDRSLFTEGAESMDQATQNFAAALAGDE